MKFASVFVIFNVTLAEDDWTEFPTGIVVPCPIPNMNYERLIFSA